MTTALTPHTPTTALQAFDPAQLRDDARQDAPQFAPDQLQIAWLRVVQSNSEVATRGHERYNPDARAGMFLHTATDLLLDGEAGVTVVVCRQEPRFTEWRPAGNRREFVRDLGTRVPDGIVGRTERNQDVFANGNLCLRAERYHVLVLHEGKCLPAVLDLAGSQLKVAREWNTRIAMVRHRDAQGEFAPPMYFMAWRLTTVYQSNDDGNWYGVKVTPLAPTHTLEGGALAYAIAKQHAEIVRGGGFTLETEDAEVVEGEAEVVHGEPEPPAPDVPTRTVAPMSNLEAHGIRIPGSADHFRGWGGKLLHAAPVEVHVLIEDWLATATPAVRAKYERLSLAIGYYAAERLRAKKAAATAVASLAADDELPF